MNNIFQWLVAAIQISNFFVLAHWAINGRKQLKPSGFPGLVSYVIAWGCFVFIYYKAGAFSTLFK